MAPDKNLYSCPPLLSFLFPLSHGRNCLLPVFSTFLCKKKGGKVQVGLGWHPAGLCPWRLCTLRWHQDVGSLQTGKMHLRHESYLAPLLLCFLWGATINALLHLPLSYRGGQQGQHLALFPCREPCLVAPSSNFLILEPGVPTAHIPSCFSLQETFVR